MQILTDPTASQPARAQSPKRPHYKFILALAGMVVLAAVTVVVLLSNGI